MFELKTIKNGILIAKQFGIRHAARRFFDLMAVNKENRRKNKLYDQLKSSGAVVKNVMGNKMQLNMEDYGVHRDLFLDGIREPVATNHLMKKLTKEDVVLEIGANIGYYVLIESKLCKKVYAVEPIAKNYENLLINIKLNDCQNVKVFQMALGDVRGKKKINISAKSNLHSFYPIKNAVKTESIPIDTVDHFLIDKESPTFIRMDVEGYEHNILCGMQKSLPSVKRIFMEIHADIMKLSETRELISLLRERGFKPELIVKYDKPRFSKVLSNSHIDKIYAGDKGVYEVFFRKH